MRRGPPAAEQSHCPTTLTLLRMLCGKGLGCRTSPSGALDCRDAVTSCFMARRTDGPKYADDFSLFCWGSGCPLQDRMGYEYTTKEYGGDGDVVHFPMSTGGPQGSVATILNELFHDGELISRSGNGVLLQPRSLLAIARLLAAD